MNSAVNIRTWIIAPDLAGTRNQCKGVAQRLPCETKTIVPDLRQPWQILSPHGYPCACMFKNAHEFTPPWPDLVIASGRQSVLPARYIKEKAGDSCTVVFLQNPRINPRCFDLVAAPAHDRLRGDNVITTTAAPNAITQAKLDQARKDFKGMLEPLPSPRVAVLIGGNSKTHKLTQARMREIATQLRSLFDHYGAGLMITTSRRSPEGTDTMLREALSDVPAFIWDGSGDNPYMGMLAWADTILVSEDSTSMLAEAASTGTPVYRIPLEGGSAKFNRLHANLEASGAVRTFHGSLEHWTYTPLDDAGLVANAIQENLACADQSHHIRHTVSHTNK